MSAVLPVHYQHCDIGLFVLTLADYAANDAIAVIRHDGQLWKLTDKVVVGEDTVRFSKLCADGIDHPLKLLFARELSEG